MFERFIQAVRTDAPGSEEPAATRDRLKSRFAPGAVRRMTQLGMFVGAVLGELQPGEDDALVYATQFGEGRALEGYLDSFPAASPTLFQTSIHPSGVQQGLIVRQKGVAELFPFAGAGCMVGHALVAALVNPAPRVLFCGGEERGSWLREHGAASSETYAFAMALTASAEPGSLGCLRIEDTPQESAALLIRDWFGLLEKRTAFDGMLLPGLKLRLVWNA